MTRQELAAWIHSQVLNGQSTSTPDNELVDQYLKSHPQVKVEEPDEGKGFQVLPTVIRLAPSVAGSVIGALGGPIGESAGGAIGTGLGEGAAQVYEYLSGGKPFRPRDIAAAAAVGAIPFGGEASILKQAVKGAGVGAASSAIQDVIGEGKLPDLEKTVLSGGAGAVLGAGGGAIGKALPKVESSEAPATADVISQIKKDLEEAKQPGLRAVAPQPIPQGRPRTEDELLSQTWVKNLPEDVQPMMQDILLESNRQRRGVQPIARSQALGTHVTVPTELNAPGATMNVEKVAAHRMALSDLGTDITQLASRIQDATTKGLDTAADKALFLKKKAQFDAVGLNLVGATTEAARVLRIAQEPIPGMAFTDSETMKLLFQNPKFSKNIDKLIDAVAATKGDPAKQFDLLVKSRALTKTEAAQNVIYTNILSGVKTPLRKAIGDSMNMVADIANVPFAWGADVMRSALTGKQRTIYLGEIGPQLYGALSGMKAGSKEFSFIMSHGYSLKNIELFQSEGEEALGQVHPELPGGLLTNYPSRVLKATTAFFHEMTSNMELQARAYSMARAAGMKTPGQIKEYVVKLLTGEGDFLARHNQLVKASQDYGKWSTFMDESGKVLKLLGQARATASPPVKLALTFLLPVYRLPGKIIQRGLETSPAGFVMKRAVGAIGDERVQSQALGRAAMGTLAMVPFAMLAIAGRLSGAGPQDPKQREALMEKGWRPESIKLGKEWVDYKLFQPFVTEMTIAASAWDRFMESPRTDKDAQDAWDAMERGLEGGVKTAFDQSYFAGLSAFFRAIEDPERSSGSIMRGIAQDMVPYSGLMRNVTQAIDPEVRKPQGIGESVETIIPGMSTNVPPQLTRFGQPVERTGGPLQRGFNPVGISEEKTDPVAEMLDALKVQLGVPQGRLSVKGQNVPLTRDQKQALAAALGQERRSALEPLAGQSTVSRAQVRRALERASRLVDQKAVSQLRRGQTLSTDKLVRPKLTKDALDRLYELYVRDQQ